MDSRERVLKALRHEEPDRVPIQDSPWGFTVERWKNEGMPRDMGPAEYFDYEIVTIGCDNTPRFPTEIVEKTDEFVLRRLSTGAINKNFRDHESTPELVERPIKTRDDWEKIKERLRPDYTRVDWVTSFNTYHEARSEGKFICFNGGYGYDILQGYMRSDQLLMAMVTDADWIRDMVMTIANLTVDMTQMVMDKGLQCDGFFAYNDMGYRNGMLFSPETYRKTQKEADSMVYSFCHEHDLPVLLHSCGGVKEVIPDLIDAGLDCLQPLEVKAGMDLIELKREYGDRLAFMGGIDVRAMAAADPDLIEQEISSKIPVAKEGGGYIYHSDHSVPSNVSFEQYKRVIELVKKYGQY